MQLSFQLFHIQNVFRRDISYKAIYVIHVIKWLRFFFGERLMIFKSCEFLRHLCKNIRKFCTERRFSIILSFCLAKHSTLLDEHAAVGVPNLNQNV
jgi:hypothetical protein